MAKAKKKKIYKKKLTSSGAGVVVLTLFAALLSIAAALGDILATAAYNYFYDKPIDHFFAGTADSYIHLYSLGVTMSVFCLIMFIWAVSSARSKKLGREFGFIGLCLPAAVCAVPAYDAVILALGKATKDGFATGYDGDKFRAIMNIAVNGVPALAGVLMMIAGIIVLVRISDESFAARVPAAGSRDNGPDPLSFGSNTPEPSGDPDESFKRPVITPVATADEPKSEEKPGEPESAKTEEPRAEGESGDKPAGEQEPAGELRICKNCGTIAKGNEKFCSNCGTLL